MSNRSELESSTTGVLEGKFWHKSFHNLAMISSLNNRFVVNTHRSTDTDKIGGLIGDRENTPWSHCIQQAITPWIQLRKRDRQATSRDPWTVDALSAELTTVEATRVADSNNNSLVTEAKPPQPTHCDNGGQQQQADSATSPAAGRTVHGHRDLHASGFSLSGKSDTSCDADEAN